MVYKVDLTKIQGGGDFPCPNCGVIISPEDETEEAYRILETKVRGQTFEGLVIQCNNCGSKISLVGFLIPMHVQNLRNKEEFTCPECGVYVDQAEQDKVEGNYYVCANCFMVTYRAR